MVRQDRLRVPHGADRVPEDAHNRPAQAEQDEHQGHPRTRARADEGAEDQDARAPVPHRGLEHAVGERAREGERHGRGDLRDQAAGREHLPLDVGRDLRLPDRLVGSVDEREEERGEERGDGPDREAPPEPHEEGPEDPGDRHPSEHPVDPPLRPAPDAEPDAPGDPADRRGGVHGAEG